MSAATCDAPGHRPIQVAGTLSGWHEDYAIAHHWARKLIVTRRWGEADLGLAIPWYSGGLAEAAVWGPSDWF